MAGPGGVRRDLPGPDTEDLRGVLGTYWAAYHARHHQGLPHEYRLSLPRPQKEKVDNRKTMPGTIQVSDIKCMLFTAYNNSHFNN